MSQYHINRAGASFGPYSNSEARQHLASGRIIATDLVWCDGMPAWKLASEVFGLDNLSDGAAIHTPPPLAPPPPPPFATQAAPQLAQYRTSNLGAGANQSLPMPPKLHWALLLLFTILTVGIFIVVWMFIQANWAKKIDPQSKATLFLAGYLVLAVIGLFIDGSKDDSAKLGGALLQLVSVGLCVTGYFSIRASMLEYFNKIEPIGLRLSGAMTFFFNALYMQYHMTRIAEWKQSGFLRPQ